MNFRRAGIATLTLVGFLFLIFYLARPSPPPRVFPKPNGYDDFIKAGMMIQDQMLDVRDLSVEDLRDYVRTNGPALKLVREGLKKQCRVTIENAPDFQAESAHILQFAAVKRCALALSAEGKLAERENRLDDAANIYLELIKFSCASGTGGVVIDKLVSAACEQMGTRSLTDIVSHLENKGLCLVVVHELEELDSKRETLDEIMKNEKEWSQHNYTLMERVVAPIFFTRQAKAAASRFSNRMRAEELRSRQLMVALAVRAFELAEGRKPKSFVELVPSYLKEIPKDPTTGTNISYSF
jgi:hypothetical protein